MSKNSKSKVVINSIESLGKLTLTAETPPQRPEGFMLQPQSRKDK